MHRGFAPVLRALLLDISEVLVEHDAALARERNKALAARTTDDLGPLCEEIGGRALACDASKPEAVAKLFAESGTVTLTGTTPPARARTNSIRVRESTRYRRPLLGIIQQAAGN